MRECIQRAEMMKESKRGKCIAIIRENDVISKMPTESVNKKTPYRPDVCPKWRLESGTEPRKNSTQIL